MRTWSLYQLAVFENVARGTGHTIVKAVAGSGKTTTIEEAANHIPLGLRTLFVAFNKDIATVLGKRLAGKPVEVSTLHSYGLKCVSASLGRLQINQYRVNDFAREMFKKEVAGIEADIAKIEESPSPFGAEEDNEKVEALRARIRRVSERCRNLTKVVSLAKGALAGSEEQVDALIDRFSIDIVDRDADRDEAAEEADRALFVKQVIQLLERCSGTEDGQIDFDDMIWLPIVLDLPQRKFDRVFVDETQDLNAAQIELTLRACKAGGRILAVGDPRQAIYQFRGADEFAFDNVKARLQATELPLSVCYRCCASVVREAQEIVTEIEAAPGAEEGEVTHVKFAEMEKSARAGDFILSRTNAPLISLCMTFLAEGRKANIQGRDVGASLAAFVKKSGAADVASLRTYVEEWSNKECARLAAKGRDTQAAEDRAACVLALSDGAPTVADVVARIETLFADKDDAGRITLSTTHKAKGLERHRVWLLNATYRRRPGIEEDNLYYVAVTRAQKSLFIVEGRKQRSSKPDGDS